MSPLYRLRDNLTGGILVRRILVLLLSFGHTNRDIFHVLCDDLVSVVIVLFYCQSSSYSCCPPTFSRRKTSLILVMPFCKDRRMSMHENKLFYMDNELYDPEDELS